VCFSRDDILSEIEIVKIQRINTKLDHPSALDMETERRIDLNKDLNKKTSNIRASPCESKPLIKIASADVRSKEDLYKDAGYILKSKDVLKDSVGIRDTTRVKDTERYFAWNTLPTCGECGSGDLTKFQNVSDGTYVVWCNAAKKSLDSKNEPTLDHCGWVINI